MPQYHLLRETPDDSGNWIATGEVLSEHSRDDAMDHAATLSAAGGRFAIYEYNSLRVTPTEATPEPVVAEEPMPEPQSIPEPAPEPSQDAAEHPTS